MEAAGKNSGRRKLGEKILSGGRGGRRSNKEAEVKSLIASALGLCTGIWCAAGDEAFVLDLRG